MTRDDVLTEFGSSHYDGPTTYEQMADEIVRLREERESVSSQLHDCENERDGLRDRLAAVEAEREVAP